MVNQTTRAEDESEETVLGVELLDLVEETSDNIVTTRSLATAEDDTHVHFLGIGLCGRFKLYDRHTIGVGEQLLNLFLVAYALCGLTFLDFDCTLKSLRQLGLISGSRQLQCTFFHITFY